MIRTLHAIVFLLLLAIGFLVSSFAWTDPQVHLLLEELDGLQPHAQVTYKGIPVGYVADVDLFDESPNEQTYFVATLVIHKDKFDHLYREMRFKIEPVALLSPQKHVLIDDDDIVKLNHLRRNEYLFGYSPRAELSDQVFLFLDGLESQTKPLREEIGHRFSRGIQTIVRRLSPSVADSTQ